jgi:hypothetical protein
MLADVPEEQVTSIFKVRRRMEGEPEILKVNDFVALVRERTIPTKRPEPETLRVLNLCSCSDVFVSAVK